MKCIKEEKFLDYFNNDLSELEKNRIEAHLKTCSDCKAKFWEWKKTVEITEKIVKTDKSNMKIPDFDFERLKEVNDEVEEDNADFKWIRYWVKPAIAVAIVVIISLSVLFFPQQNNFPTQDDNYLVLQDNILETTTIATNEENLIYLELAILQEIYSDEGLRQQILKGDLGDSDDMFYQEVEYEEISQADLKLIEQELNTMRTS